jgi:CcmD family protein
MRPLTALGALLFMTATVSAFQATRPSPGNPALPPDPPPPLYLAAPPEQELRRLHEPPTEDEIERLLRTRQRDVRPVGTQGAAAQASGVQQTQPTDEFIPISEIPPEDRLPAAPMLVAAYAFVMLAIFGYVLSLSRRLNAVARDLAKFEAQSKRP